ncbi:hypothetical protein LCGC14_1203250 [marine sediment metagenome]|uniref:DNA methylase N-4/N-6 domain-containing protein n=1 Tax=marine sediment metagenome TaxID=412755 RepID=A0A0F9NYP2_9ZZZZ
MELRYYFKPNTIYCGDNLKVLKSFPDECVDLIYIDPPFFSGKNYDLVFGDKYAIRAFQDTFEGKKETYLSFMEDRIREMHRILKPTGSFYLHCDWHANAHLRVLCDKIFGENNYRNEIIWRIGWLSGYKTKKVGWIRNHDTIHYYVKSKDFTFNKEYIPYKDDYVRRDGKKPTGKGLPIEDTWNCSRGDILNSIAIMSFSKEKLGYPTQKPESLLKRIIKASSNEGDIVADFFCGCGTTLAVAQKLNRQWIGIDVSPIGCTVMAKRIGYKLKDVQGMKYSLKQAHELDWMDFQKWTIKAIDGIPLTKKGADKGVDGWQNNNKFNESVPIEVKQHTIGRPDVQKFNTVIEREKKKGGFMIAFKISKPAIVEIKRLKRETKRDLIFISFDELMDKGILMRKGATKPDNVQMLF